MAAQYAISFSGILHGHLHAHNVITNCMSTTCKYERSHREVQIVKISKKLMVAKNKARRNISLDIRTFLNSVRVHNKLLKLAKKQQQFTSVRRQEKAFLQNPWKFSKSACSDNESKGDPSFSSSEVFEHFSSTFSGKHCHYQSLPRWIEDCMPSSTITEDFDMSPITPSLVKAFLKKCSSTSSPGEDGISYAILKRLPSCHHFLATLYSKTLLMSWESPQPWCSGKIILIHKKGDCSVPGNFRPIALTSTIGKLFHKILAFRIERFCLDNDIIDDSIQKGFLKGVNGTMEHILSVISIIEHAKSNGLPVTMSFFDLKNAFGSIPHRLIFDVLAHIKLPQSVRCYIQNNYSQLSAYVQTKYWRTKNFQIGRGVFQGDTMSPIIFLLSFNPILKLVSKLQYPGFFFKIPITNTEHLPEPNSFIYVQWNESNSDEPPGWYKCVISGYNRDGKALLIYSDNQEEVIDLDTVNWKLSRKNSKCYRSLSSPPPSLNLSSYSPKNKLFNSVEHKVKSFADDLTIISTNLVDHQSMLSKIDACCSDLSLQLRPDKCITMSYTGKKFNKQATVKLSGGSTTNISQNPAKFLGKYLITDRLSAKRPANVISSLFKTAITNLDKRPIRGEYKLWIYQHYIATSLNFQLTVNRLPKTFLKKLEDLGTKKLKKWLHLPKSATRAILYHPQVLSCPQISVLYKKAKLSYLVAIEASADEAIKELHLLINNSPNIRDALGFSQDCLSVIEAGKKSTAIQLLA